MEGEGQVEINGCKPHVKSRYSLNFLFSSSTVIKVFYRVSNSDFGGILASEKMRTCMSINVHTAAMSREEKVWA